MPRWLNIANLFTFLRLIAVPFAMQAVLRGEHGRALAIVALAAITDAVDGTLARRFGMATPEGAYFDPIVDKVFLSAIFISLASIGSAPWWIVIVIFARDAIILTASGLAILLARKRQFPPSLWGKASTFLQIVYALWLMFANATGWGRPELLMWPVAALTSFSGVHYIWRGLRDLQSAQRPAPSSASIS
jgi:cardiolipin synthase (CMP-forming)